MKKSRFIFIFVFFFGILVFFLPFLLPNSIFDPSTSTGSILLYIMIFMLLFIVGLYYKFEESIISSKEISLIAVYSTFVSIARIPFIGIPSVQPVTYLVFCAGIVFGPMIGFIIGGNTAIISNIFAGQGIWTLYQVFGWGFVGIFAGYLGLLYKRSLNFNNSTIFRILISIVGFCFGFFYGWFTNIWSWVITREFTFQSFILVNTWSFYLDLSHALSNFIFLFFFGS